MKVKENLPIMVLTHDAPHNLRFEFKSILWGCISLLIGVSLGVATYFAVFREDAHWIVLLILGLLTLLFLYASIYSFTLRRSLEIDDTERVVTYQEASLFKNITWQKKFQSFKLIKAFRPQTTATSSGGRPAVNWSIQLISKEEEVFEIGYSQFGAMTRNKAEELVNRIAMILSVQQEIVE